MRALDVATSYAASIARAGTGMQVGTLGARPQRPLDLYEFEACPYCRKVREALSLLDLDANIHPCPQGGPTFRPVVRQKGGKEQFPYLVDPNTGAEMYESDEIVRYLYSRYGDGRVPWALSLPVVTDVTSSLASAWRLLGGRSYRNAKMPAQPLELWSFEASPYCRLVREKLCELELPYLLHNVAKGSARRADFVSRSGRMMVPYLHDPNTGSEMFESADICAYLELTYAR
ncbi:MAG TPA: glutathione S-transferase N-terminal domain-containing protein [Candidatus Limnocylindrales bacterium]|nr:glutathione S-transferase N-terminal domain-containing protein [Candidatus Limnocylindrales bacterium]